MTTINERGYWETTDDDGHYYDIPLCIGIYNFLKINDIKTLLDLGCGKADYCKYFMSQGVHCDAYDGNPNTKILSGGIGKVIDLSKDIELKNKYDCVMSLEVGEHIPAQYENCFINNICRHSNKWIILSWAIIGQGGNGHVNCRNNEYIIEQLLNRGFLYDYEVSKTLRENANIFWFKNTLMVFKTQES